MKSLTDVLKPHAAAMDEWFRKGAQDAFAGRSRTADHVMARMLYADHRPAFGFENMPAPLLTWPKHQHKLQMGTMAAYGLTLQHWVTRISPKLVVNSCPHAGDCVAVCVLNRGHGNRNDVIQGRKSKTSFLVQQPRAFCYLLGYELAMAVMRDGTILWRPNVNSDARWEELIPSAFDGSIFGTRLIAYDYTKDAERVLHTDGWVALNYRVSYSWNENSEEKPVRDFRARGGSIAVVTSRRKGEPLRDLPLNLRAFGYTLHLDADKTDEWMFEPGAIGDLSAKGKARSLRGKSDFVVMV